MDFNSKIFLTAIAIGLIVVWFFVWPNLQDIQQTRQTIQEENQDLAILLETQGTIEQAVNFYEGLSQSERALVELAAPSHPARVELTGLLTDLLVDNGFTVNEVSVGGASPAQKPGELGTLPVNMSFEGDYDTAKALVELLEDYLRVANIESVQITAPPQDADDDEEFSINIEATVYYTTAEGEATGTSSSNRFFFNQ